MNEFLVSIRDRLRQELDPQTMGAELAAFASSLLVGLLIFVAIYLVWRMLDRVLRAVLSRSRIDATSASFLQTALKFVALTIAVVQGLAAAGVNTAALLTSLGIAGLTIGFAARDALSNLISGLLIFWDRPFVIGDLVEVEEYYGRVDRITLRSTRVVTVDGKMLAVPNSTIINSTVASYTNFPHLRLDIDVSIGVNEEVDRARAVLLALVRENPDFMDDPPPRVVVTGLNDYNTALQLQAWVEDEREHIRLRFDLRERVFEGLAAAGVEMPFETLRIEPIAVHLEPGPGGTLPEPVAGPALSE